MKKLVLCILIWMSFILLWTASTLAAEGDSLWSKTFGADGVEWSTSLIKTTDGGYLLAGPTESFGAGSKDFWLVKTDLSGDSLWSKTYGGASAEWVYSLIETSDGGYLLAGYTNSFGAGNYDMWLVKTDLSGDSLWSKTFGGALQDYAFSLIETSDGGYMLTGMTESFGAGNYDMWLVKTDLNGDSLWSKTFGGALSDKAISIIETSDGGYLLTGFTGSFGAGYHDMWLVKTDLNGDSLWSITFGGADDDAGFSLIETSDGGYLTAGRTESFGAGDYDTWLVKTDLNGDSLWSKTFGGASADETKSLIETSDGGYLLAGYTYSFGAGSCDMWLVKTNSNGDSLWSKTFGGADTSGADKVIETLDGGYLLAGWTNSFGAGATDMWLLYAEGSPTALDIMLTPYGTPIQIPASGGSFDYNIAVSNNTSAALTFDVWTVINLPELGQFEVLNVQDITLPDSTTADRDRTQEVPEFAPAGTYTYYAYVGDYPWVINDFDSLNFDKEGDDQGGSLGSPLDWPCTGESFEQWQRATEIGLPSEYILAGAYPNPFNPLTSISFGLPESGHVRLAVYDPLGRQVELLANGHREAGVYEVTFDGSGLASGIYIYRLDAGGFTSSGKMVLMK